MRDRAMAAVLLAAALLIGAGAGTAQNPANGFIGTDACLKCHIDFARRWAALDHSQAMLAERFPPENRGCEACHGPGMSHSIGKREQILGWDELELPQRQAICLKCHDDLIATELWPETIHAEMLGCGDCHEVHRETEQDWLLKRPQDETCADCHDLAGEIEAGRHHPLFDGGLTCEMCHDFHGSSHGELLNAPMKELCAECHDEVPKPESHARENFKLNHGDVAKADPERCTTCHDEQADCLKCHAAPFPHPENFALEHTAPAQEHPETCLNCHQNEDCLICHETVPPPVGPAEKAEPGA